LKETGKNDKEDHQTCPSSCQGDKEQNCRKPVLIAGERSQHPQVAEEAVGEGIARDCVVIHGTPRINQHGKEGEDDEQSTADSDDEIETASFLQCGRGDSHWKDYTQDFVKCQSIRDFELQDGLQTIRRELEDVRSRYPVT